MTFGARSRLHKSARSSPGRSGDGNLARLFPNGLPAYLSDPKLPVFLRDLGAYLNHAHARYREVGFKLPAAPVQVLVENTLGEQDFRDKASGLIHVGASSTGRSCRTPASVALISGRATPVGARGTKL